MIDITLHKAIASLNPLARYSMSNGLSVSNLDLIEWMPDHVGHKPTKDEIVQKYNELVSHQPVETIKEQRRLAYLTEADPLFFKWQAGENTEEEWKSARQAVKDRYPY